MSERIAELEAEVERLKGERDEATRARNRWQSERDAAQAQLRDAQGQVAALAASMADVDGCSVIPDLPAASKAILAAAEREQGLREALGHWVQAYGPDLVVYPSQEEVRAVNETPEFRIGRNATMQVVSEGLQKILTDLDKADAALAQEGEPS